MVKNIPFPVLTEILMILVDYLKKEELEFLKLMVMEF